MAYCGKCVEKINDGAKFCCHCGSAAEDDGETSIPQEQEPLAYPSKLTGGAFASRCSLLSRSAYIRSGSL